jgi:hypothetical protein
MSFKRYNRLKKKLVNAVSDKQLSLASMSNVSKLRNNLLEFAQKLYEKKEDNSEALKDIKTLKESKKEIYIYILSKSKQIKEIKSKLSLLGEKH